MSAPATHRRRVLVIEDDQLFSRLITRVLRERHDVSVAMNGKEALERFDLGERYDLIFCDLQMPQMTGVDFLMNLDHIAPDQVDRIVFLTARPDHPMAKLITDNEIIDKTTRESIAAIAKRCLERLDRTVEEREAG